MHPSKNLSYFSHTGNTTTKQIRWRGREKKEHTHIHTHTHTHTHTHIVGYGVRWLDNENILDTERQAADSVTF